MILRIHNVLKRVYKDDPALINVDGYAIDEEKRKVLFNKERNRINN